MHRLEKVFLVLILLSAGFCAIAFADSLQWIYSYEDAIKIATREGKPIMAGFYTTWCGYCKKLDDVTYVDGMVIAASKNFICLKVDGGKRPDVAAAYEVSKVPMIIFLYLSGRVIWKEFGYREPAQLARRMREVLDYYNKSRVAEPYIRSAFDEAGRGRIDEALDILDKAVAAYPGDARLYAARSSIYSHKGDIDAALRDLDVSLSINPTDEGVLIMRGITYYKKRDLEKAMDDYNKAISINLWAYEAYNGRGLIHLDQNSLDLAVKNFNTTTLINPRHISAYFNRGIAYLQKGDMDKAIRDFSKVIELDPNQLNAYSIRADAYMRVGQYDNSWADVHLIESRGLSMKPEFITELKRLSSREQ